MTYFRSRTRLPASPLTFTLPDASLVSWRPSQYTVLTVPSGFTRLLNWAVWMSRCPLLNTMVLSPFLGEEKVASALLVGARAASVEGGGLGPPPGLGEGGGEAGQ